MINIKELQIGDVVRICDDISECYDVAEPMLKYQGRTAIVTCIDIPWASHAKVWLDVDNGRFMWYDEMLECVDAEPPEMPYSFADLISEKR